MNLEQKTSHEATLDGAKFFRLIYVRMKTQGLRATLLWIQNLMNRWILDRPVRKVCQVTPQLFVGAQFGERGWEVLQDWGITAVVNLREEFDDRTLGLDLGRYCFIPTADDQVPSLEGLKQGIQFIAEEIEGGGKVYIHCGSGVGRAPSMAAAYLVSLGSDPASAWETVRKARPFIRPTRVQRVQLERLALELEKIE